MIICGLKLTHDSSVALIDNGQLMFLIELEKINNNNRFKILEDLSEIEEILNSQGYALKDVDRFVIDGWVGMKEKHLSLSNQNESIQLPVAPYHESGLDKNLMQRYTYDSLPIGNTSLAYSSYMHSANHLTSSYCTSPFSKKQEAAYILIWDGGMYPRLYFFDPKTKTNKNLGPLFFMGVNIYSIFAQHFGPFKINENVIKDELSIAGKVMAYAAHGKTNPSILVDLEQTYQATYEDAIKQESIPNYPYSFTKFFRNLIKEKYYYDEDIISSFHSFLEQKLIQGLKEKTGSDSERPNLCLGGGAALNIKWNSSIRRSGIFKEVWVCPVPNDSGSALGAACSELLLQTDKVSLEWNIFKGPNLQASDLMPGWSAQKCDLPALAELLHASQEPVIFLEDRAALGPRALGHRSILASPQKKEMKSILNTIKIREPYRPIAPICLEEKAVAIFDPGTPDPYMLFDHKIKPEWLDKIPAVSHLDGTARVQTVNSKNAPKLYQLLSHFEEISGLPVLCNTSANFKGSGFFPDLFSASRWGKVNYIWSADVLYRRI